MRGRKILKAFLSVLIILSLFQIILDWAFDDRDRAIDNGRDNMIVTLEEVNYCIFIDIEYKTLYLLENGKCIREYSIASGMSGLPSPLGYWEIVEKGDWGEGFGGRWLGLDVPWGT